MARVLLLFTCVLFCSSCAPIKGYSGPDLPDNQVSLVVLGYDSNRIDVSAAAINGVEFGTTGIKILPGQHSFEMTVVVKDPPDHCYGYPEFDYYGYNDCIKKANKKGGYCDCWDYLKTYRRCYQRVRDGTCRGTLNTQAGKQYEILATQSERKARVQVSDRAAYKKSGEGTCSEWGEPRTETTNDYVGTGRYTANSNGIYGCYGG